MSPRFGPLLGLLLLAAAPAVAGESCRYAVEGDKFSTEPTFAMEPDLVSGPVAGSFGKVLGGKFQVAKKPQRVPLRGLRAAVERHGDDYKLHILVGMKKQRSDVAMARGSKMYVSFADGRVAELPFGAFVQGRAETFLTRWGMLVWPFDVPTEAVEMFLSADVKALRFVGAVGGFDLDLKDAKASVFQEQFQCVQ